MKKLFLYLLAVVLTLTMALTLAACGGDTPEDPEGPGNSPDATHTHTPTDWIIDTEATCTADGAKHKACTTCDEVVESATIPKLSHTASDWIIDTNPTCTVAGAKHKECTACGTSIESGSIEKLDHTPSDWITDTEPTCSSEGTKHKECTVCETPIENGSIDKLDHTPSDWITDTESSCTVAGTKHIECTVCKAPLETGALDLLAHKYENDACTECGKIYYSEGMYYTLNSDGAGYTLAGPGTSTDTYIRIPPTYEGLPVTEISRGAFYEKDWITRVKIPDGVKSIGPSAFQGCYNLLMVELPSTLTAINAQAFEGCYKLVDVYNRSSLDLVRVHSDANGSITKYPLNIYKNADESCITFTDDGFVFHENFLGTYLVSYIGTETNIVLPESFDGKDYEIHQYSFYADDKIETISIPKGVTSIGGYAFNFTKKLTTVTIANDSRLASIGTYAFNTSESLERVSFGNNSSLESTSGYLFENCYKLTEVDFGDNSALKTISARTFDQCYNLAFVSFGENSKLTTINGYAFRGCRNLVRIVIPAGVTQINKDAFRGCNKLFEIQNLSNLNITAGGTDHGYIAEYAKHIYKEGNSAIFTTDDGFVFYKDAEKTYLLSYAGAATDLVLPESFEGQRYEIYKQAFRENAIIKKLFITDGVSHIGDGAFMYCTNLVKAVISDGVTSSGTGIFNGCTSATICFTADSVPSGFNTKWNNSNLPVRTTWTYGLHSPSSWEITLEPTCGTDGTQIIKCDDCGITLETDVVSKTGNHTINTEWTISKAPTCIADGEKHKDCTVCGDILETATIDKVDYHTPSDWIVETADTCRFAGSQYKQCVHCFEKIETQTIPRTKSHNFVNDTCEGCGIILSKGLEYTISDDGTYYIVTGIGNCTDTDIVIPSTHEGLPVAAIGPYAFEYNKNISTVDVLDGMKTIGYKAFDHCEKLLFIVFSDTVETIEFSAFDTCKSLLSATLPAGIKALGSGAFSNCDSLRSFTIPAGITKLEWNTFYGCNNLKTVTISEGVVEVDLSAFISCPMLEKIELPSTVTTITRYTSTIYVGTISAPVIVSELNSTFKSIDGSVFTKDGKGLVFLSGANANAVIPEGVETILNNAATMNTAITSITIPSTVTTIGEAAFMDCSELVTITFANKSQLKTISTDAFRRCSKLERVYLPSGTTTLGAYSFYGCAKLERVVIPMSVTVIDSSAFSIDQRTTFYCERSRQSVPDTWGYGWWSNASSFAYVIWEYKKMNIDPYL